jgi:hypothetical protein
VRRALRGEARTLATLNQRLAASSGESATFFLNTM